MTAAKAADPPFKMGGTGSKREDHVLTVFMERRPAPSSPTCPINRAARRRPSLSVTTRRPTSTTLRRISKSGAPGRSARSACSTRNGSPTRPRSPTPCRGTIFHVQGRRTRRAVPDAARHVPSGQGDARPDCVLCRSVQEARRRPRNTGTTWKSRRSKPVFLTGKDMLTFLEEGRYAEQEPHDRGRLRRPIDLTKFGTCDCWTRDSPRRGEVVSTTCHFCEQHHADVRNRDRRRRSDRAG